MDDDEYSIMDVDVVLAIDFGWVFSLIVYILDIIWNAMQVILSFILFIFSQISLLFFCKKENKQTQ